jgi:hypothetical protein
VASSGIAQTESIGAPMWKLGTVWDADRCDGSHRAGLTAADDLLNAFFLAN